MRRGARAPVEPRPFCSLSDARAAVIPVHRNAGSDGVSSRFIHTPHSGSLEIIPLCSRSREAVISVHRNARSAAVLSRTSIPLSLSLFLSVSVSFSAIRSHSLYFLIMFSFFFFSYYFIGFMILFGFSIVCSSGPVRDTLGQFGYPWVTHARWKFSRLADTLQPTGTPPSRSHQLFLRALS